MATASLTATSRTATGKGVARKLRAEGKVPGVVYGHKRAPQPLVLDNREIERLFTKIAAASTVIELSIDGVARKTLVREIQRHPLNPGIVHIDFLELVAGEVVKVRVHLTFEGTPVGVRSDGGILEETLHEIEIEADPSNIPERIVVDVSGMHIGHSLHVGDVKLPAGVELVTNAGVTICLVSAPRAEEAVKPAADAATTPTEPELIRKAKEDEEGEAAAGEKK